MKKLVALLMVFSVASMACYNSYHISMDQLKELQVAEQGQNKVATTERGRAVEVTPETRMFVRDQRGRKYPITPYNYQITQSQLVASDRDYIFMLDQLRDRGEIEQLSTWKTVGLITAGAGAVVGLIIVTIVTAGKKSFTVGTE